MALPHTSCVFCDGVYLYDQCTCETAVEGGLDSAPRCPCGAGRSLPATRAIAEGIDPDTRTHRTSDRPRGTRRQPLSIIARYYRSSACTAVVALQCIVTQTCMFQPSTCMLVACRTISLGGGAKLVAPREWDFIYHFLDCGTNLRTETCLYTKSAKKRRARRGVGGQEWRGREATKEGCTAAAPIVRPQMEYL